MTIYQRKGTHVSRYIESLRTKRGLKPSQLAFILQAKNISKIASLIRQFELTGDISSFWFEKLIIELNPEKDELQRCIEQDQKDHILEIKIQKIKWNEWADEPINPFLTIRYLPAFYGTKEVPKELSHSRKESEEWCSKELQRLRVRGFLNWTRKNQTLFQKGGLNPRRIKVIFEETPSFSWMKLSATAKKFIFKENFISKKI